MTTTELNTAYALMRKFYAAGTTVAEERKLLRLLRHPGCPPALAADRLVLEAALEACANVPVPEGLERRIGHGFRRATARHTCLRISRWCCTTAAAAAVAVVALLRPPTVATVYADTYHTPHEAALGAEHTLQLVSDNLNLALGAGEQDLGGPCP